MRGARKSLARRLSELEAQTKFMEKSGTLKSLNRSFLTVMSPEKSHSRTSIGVLQRRGMVGAVHQLRAQQALRDELRAALSPLYLHDVREFLLGTDARVDAAIVTDSGAKARSVALDVRTESAAVSGDSLDTNFEFTLFSEWLILPVMKRNTYSLGVHLCRDDRRTSVGVFKPVVAACRFRRYARNPSSGAYISVAHCGSDTELIYLPSVGNSPRSRGGKWFRFDSESFQAVMAGVLGKDAFPDVDSLLECLNVVYAFDEVRDCSSCGAPPETSCTCNTSPSPSRVPVLKTRIDKRRGKYVGGAVIDFLVGGVSFRSVQLHRKTSFDFSDNPSLDQDLLFWAARDRLSELSPSVTKLVMPTDGDPQVVPMSMGATIGNPVVIDSFVSEPLPVLHEVSTSDPEGSNNFETGDEHHPTSQTNDRMELALSSISNVRNCGFELATSSNLSTQISPLYVPRRPRGSPEMTERRQRAVVSAGPAEPLVLVDDESGFRSPSLMRSPSPQAAVSGRATSASEAPARSSEDDEGNLSRALRVIKDHGGTTTITREQLLAIVPMDEEELSRVFRRARNRESAAYSNLQRKLRLQALRSNLVDLRRRKAESNVRLQALLLENRALRVALAAAGTSVPRRG